MEWNDAMMDKFKKLRSDIEQIQDINDLGKRKITISDYYVIRSVFNELYKFGKSEFIQQSVFDYFVKHSRFRCEKIDIGFRILTE